MMAIFNLTHASKTKVGSDTVRGVDEPGGANGGTWERELRAQDSG